jgi:peptide/nickel transport system substrate-binding protein
VAHAIDRQAIVDGAMFGYGTPIGTHFAPHNPAYVDLTEQSAHDPDRAASSSPRRASRTASRRP